VSDEHQDPELTRAERPRRRRVRLRSRRRQATRRARRARAALRERKARLERLGVRYFNRRARALPKVELEDAIHFLNPNERRALRRIQWGAILRAFLVGALSASVVASAMVVLLPLKGDESGGAWHHVATYWGLVGAIGVVTAIAEVGFMYWDSLRSVHSLAHAAGLDIFGGGEDSDSERAAVAAALARAALELPNPPEEIFGVDPHRELSRVRLVFVTLMYKAKISLTNFVLKALVRRMLGRAGVRTWLHYVGVPVTAAWNATVSFVVLREARIRVMGPSAVMEYVSLILDREPPLGRAGRQAAMRAVGCCIISTRDMHPNLRALLSHLRERLRIEEHEALDDRARFLSDLEELAPSERVLVLRLLYLSAIIDGRVARAERRLVNRALSICGLPPDDGTLNEIKRAFVHGDPAPAQRLRAIGSAVVGAPAPGLA